MIQRAPLCLQDLETAVAIAENAVGVWGKAIMMAPEDADGPYVLFIAARRELTLDRDPPNNE